MNLVDSVILIVIIAILGTITYFKFFKNKNRSKCDGCSYSKSCSKCGKH